MKRSIILTTILSIGVILSGCRQNSEEKRLEKFIKVHVEKVKPIEKELNLSYWNASITGKDEEYQKAADLEFKLREIYSSKNDFEFLKEQKKSGQIKNHILARQLDVLINSYLENQIEPDLLKKIVDLGTEVQKKFSTFRGKINGREITNNKIDNILRKETDSQKRKQTWLASKQVGPIVAPDIIELVKLRNQAAQKIGFKNYYILSLTTAEQSIEKLDKIFNELYELTNAPFTKLKSELDQILAGKYKVKVSELMPWHYHDSFFQETPLVYDLDLDSYYKGKNVKELAIKFYASIGLPVESILNASDLYEKERKNPHAFCTDIDREGDVRILCNLKNNEKWMETILHELGHSVYDKYHDPETPFLLRKPAHIFTTEAVAMFFGRLSRNPAWMQTMLGLSHEERAEIDKVAPKYVRMKQLIFARWAMVMYNFEKKLYANPDQDLNSLWWRLVEKYQFVKNPHGRNAPDWAAKIHFVIAPCYYHNYVLGELLASQLHHYLLHNILKLESDKNVSYVSQRKVGDFLRKKIFKAVDIYPWNEMIKRATDEHLTPKYFVEQFLKE